MNEQEGIQQITRLIKKYESLSLADRRRYNESMTCKDLILPLFQALGWDVYNKAFDYEVTSETQVSSGRVDYAFHLDGVTKFFIEAKKIETDLREARWAEQATTYAWHKSVAWAILTDFESIKVFNAEWDEPNPEQSLVFEIPYRDYLIDQRLWLFSKESIERGELDKYAERNFKKPKREPVDKQLAKDLLRWREILFGNLKKWNSDKLLGDKQLAESVQRILDRLIFIRTTEDRGIEDKRLQELERNYKEGKREFSLTEELKQLFKSYDKWYNSKLFESHICDVLEYEDSFLAEVIRELYKNKKGIRYDFASINADVLGSIYEQYLGQVQESENRKAQGKSSKRKSQGIYYTPRYIVDYIVQNTLGEVLKNKSAHEASNITILDPACGSGSFLIKGFEVLDTYIRRAKNQKGTNSVVNYTRKFSILTSNIYGVDLDQEAVEIAQLNLLLQVLDKRERLPNLAKNIEHGNSLISGDEKELKKYFGKDWRAKKPFNWQEKFPEVFKQGGFDVIIGNPPYVNLANIENKEDREWLKDHYKTAKNKSDLYSFFTERAINLLRDGGLLGFIVSNSWLGTDSFSKFREYLIKNTKVLKLVKLSLGVFADATVTPVLIILKKEKIGKNHEVKLTECRDGEFIDTPGNLTYERVINSPNYNFSFNQESKIKIPTMKLGNIAKFSLGIKTSDDKRFILNTKKDEETHPLLRGKDVGRYFYNYQNKWIWYKPKLMMEKVGAGPRKLEYFLRDKILFRSISGGIIMATLDSNRYLTNDKVHILYDSDKFSLKFILGIVNSKLINFWIKSSFGDLLEIKINQLQEIPIPKINFSNKIEKQKYDESVKSVDRMLKFNKDLQKLDPGLDKEEYEELKVKIDSLDKEINEKVYNLYNLTPEEVKIVER